MAMQGWISVADRLPTQDETLDGRVPALDEDGYLVVALLCAGRLLAAGLTVTHWSIPPRAE